MNRQIIIKSAAIVSLVIILFLIGLTVYFGLTGNVDAFLLVISSNAFFVIMLYLIMRFNRSNQIKSTLSEMEDRRRIEDIHEDDE
jgi:hypothetical protein